MYPCFGPFLSIGSPVLSNFDQYAIKDLQALLNHLGLWDSKPSPPPECTPLNPSDADPAAPCNMVQELASNKGYGMVTWTCRGNIRNPESNLDDFSTK